MTSRMRAFLTAATAIAVGASALDGVAAEARRGCLTAEETRSTIQARKLLPPVRAVEAALRVTPGESVGIRLCREETVMIYDIAVLRRDGHLIHVLVDAGNGALMPARAEH